MKTRTKYLTLLALAFYISNDAWSQRYTVNTNITIGTPVTYSYYYYPDYEIYYRVETGTWFIRRNFVWVSYAYLPSEYYFIHHSGYHRVMLPYHGSKHPFSYHNKFRSSYPKNVKVKSKKNHIDYKMNTTWQSDKPNAHMKTKISNKPMGGGNKGKGKHKRK
ncbi:MAG: hypothetical protein Q8M29_15295 [Bacteroidota bacterium]|nr:hypothetical protein [Bacteroidota bacterium]